MATIERRELYIDGAWRPAGSPAVIEVVDAHTEQVMGTVPAGTTHDAATAIESSAAALDGWSRTPRARRIEAVRALADGLEASNAPLSQLMAREVGTPITTSERVQVGLAVSVLRSMADIAEQQDPVEVVGSSVITRVPAGVVGAITPWNYPLYQLVAKLAPAMLQGCTTVLKPSSVAPLAAFDLAEIAHEAGVPAGVINLVTGAGAEVGEVLASHPLVDMVSLTGSTGAGARVATLAAGSIKRVGLELGGKSATIIAPGADLASAVAAAVRGSFVNNGQTCAALTRLVVTKEHLAEVEERAAAAVAAMVVGDPLERTTDVGPIASAGQYRAVQALLATAARDGMVLVGGEGRAEGFDCGYYARPTVVSRLSRTAELAREEVFGPVLAIIAADDLDDAIRIANDSDYGLSGAVWAGDLAEAASIAIRLRTGQVSLNGGRFNVAAPFGGFKQSGIGRELGAHGLDEYGELISMQLPTADEAATVAAVLRASL
jgi:acyl-CoA reductase-like NAD-dependent aldehyde dehydrogenase